MTADRQRLVFTIPTPATTLTLGVQHPARRGPEGIAGVTSRHIYFHGTSTDSTAVMEVPGNIRILSSEHDVLAVAKDSILLAGQSRAYLASTHRTFVSAGNLGFSKMAVGMTNQPDPQAIRPVDEMKQHLEHVSDSIGDAVRIVGLAMIPVVGLGTLLSRKISRANLASSLLSNAAIVALPAMAATVSKVAAPQFEGVAHLHGQQSALISSGRDTSVTALNSVDVMAPGLVTIASGLAASMVGTLSASIVAAGFADVKGYAKVGVLSFGRVEIASRKNTVEVLGNEIHVGSRALEVRQKSTKTIELEARRMVQAVVGPAGLERAKLQLGEDGLIATGDDHLVEGGKRVRAAAGSTSLTLQPDQAVLSCSALPAGSLAAEIALAQAAYDAEKAAAGEVFDTAVAAAASAGLVGLGPVLYGASQFPKYSRAVRAAKAKLNAAIDGLNKAVNTTLRVVVNSQLAMLTNGLAKVSVGAAGNIEIDGGGLPISIKTGAAEIKLTPAGIKMGPMIGAG